MRTWQKDAATAALVGALALAGCAGPEEAASVAWPLACDAEPRRRVETDLGYRVTLQEARVAIENLTFAVGGEVHMAARLRDALHRALLPRALAHPGHNEGGDVTGELPGRFLLDWFDAEPSMLGMATLLEGDYRSANFTFARAQKGDGLDADDPLLGHTARLRGVAEKNGDEVEFVVVLDSPKDRALTGVPFEQKVREEAPMRLRLRLLLRDPSEDDTLFDGIDFASLRGDDGEVALTPKSKGDALDAYHKLRRTFQTHDHYDVIGEAAAPEGDVDQDEETTDESEDDDEQP